jgi:benzoate-CoA ligase
VGDHFANSMTFPSGARSEFYNAAVDLIERNLTAGRKDKVALIDDVGSYTYSELAVRVDRCVNLLRNIGLEAHERLAICLVDGVDFTTSFLGAIKAGIIPTPVNTLWTASDYAYILLDSGAKAALVSDGRLSAFLEATDIAGWKGRIIVSGSERDGEPPTLSRLLQSTETEAEPSPTRPDDACFWLYSSGTTGKPKGVVHLQTSLIRTADLYAQGVLGINESDVVYSAAKLFFAYGLGNALSFPMSVGATAILAGGRVTPSCVNAILRQQRPTVFCGVPTLFSALLASRDLPRGGEHQLRLCTSAGEALPAAVARRWKEYTGVEIIDGLGSTEMLHIFLSNRPGAVSYGALGLPVPGYKVRIVNENGQEAPPGKMGELQVSGPTAAACYSNNPDKTRHTFLGEWVRTGDEFLQTSDGDFVYCGRVDEMLKVGGIWVSPVELEAALIQHEAVLEVAVTGAFDENGVVKPKAFVVLKNGFAAGPELMKQLQDFAKTRLAPYKYPRWIKFMDVLPKTSTGKLQRYLLRAYKD